MFGIPGTFSSDRELGSFKSLSMTPSIAISAIRGGKTKRGSIKCQVQAAVIAEWAISAKSQSETRHHVGEGPSTKMDGIRACLRGIEQQLRSPEARSRLGDISNRHAVFSPYQSWADLIRDFQATLLPRHTEDEILRTLISRCHKSRDPIVLAALVGLFLSRLTLIYRRCRSWDSDDGELWANLQWSFLEVVHRPQLLNRGERMAAKIFNDTRYLLWTIYKTEWARQKRELPFDDEHDCVRPGEPNSAESIEVLADSALVLRQLHRAQTARAITEDEYILILQAATAGSVRELAQLRGLDYEVLRKRIQRALHDFRHFHKKSSRRRRFHVPKISARPPSTCEKEDVRNGTITRSVSRRSPNALIGHLRVPRTPAWRADAKTQRRGGPNMVRDANFGRIATSGRPTSTEAARY